jgi:hypothetical protein
VKKTRPRIPPEPDDASGPDSPTTSGRRLRLSDVFVDKAGDETRRSLMLPSDLVRHRPAQKVPGRARGDSIGYASPPPEHRWKPGQSGNPRGRPKGRKNEATILKEILARRVAFRVGGKPKTICVLEAILYRLSADAMAGKVRSAEFILKRFGLIEGDNIPAQELSGDDRAVLEAFAQRFKDNDDGQPK